MKSQRKEKKKKTEDDTEITAEKRRRRESRRTKGKDREWSNRIRVQRKKIFRTRSNVSKMNKKLNANEARKRVLTNIEM